MTVPKTIYEKIQLLDDVHQETKRHYEVAKAVIAKQNELIQLLNDKCQCYEDYLAKMRSLGVKV